MSLNRRILLQSSLGAALAVPAIRSARAEPRILKISH